MQKNLSKIFTSVIAIFLFLLCSANVAFASWQFAGGGDNSLSPTCVITEWDFGNSDFTYGSDDNTGAETGEITGYTGDKENIVVPSTTPSGETVTKITNLDITDETKTVTIPSTVTEIDADAFGTLNGDAVIYFEGTEEEFKAAGGYEALKNAEITNALENRDYGAYLSVVFLNRSYDKYTPDVSFNS